MNLTLKQKLVNKETSIGSWVTISNHNIVHLLSEANFEFLVIDMEHTSIDFEELSILITVIKSYNISPIVRVSKCEESVIKRALDLGAEGIISPMINSLKEALDLVSYVKYPPYGKRGVGLNKAQNFGFGFEKYLEWLKNEVIIIAQIENITGVDNIEEIVSISDIDGVLIGPYDLTSSLNIPGEFNHPLYQDSINRIKKSCNRNHKSLGIHQIEPDGNKVNTLIKQGFNFIPFSVDFKFLSIKATEEMGKIKL